MDAAALNARTAVLEGWVREVKRKLKLRVSNEGSAATAALLLPAEAAALAGMAAAEASTGAASAAGGAGGPVRRMYRTGCCTACTAQDVLFLDPDHVPSTNRSVVVVVVRSTDAGRAAVDARV